MDVATHHYQFVRGSRVRLERKEMLTHTEARAEEEANVRDFYQNLVRDLQRDIDTAVGPIRESAHPDAKGFTDELTKFQKTIDEHVKSFGEMKMTGDAAANKRADEIMKSKPLSVNAPASLRPHMTLEQQKAAADADKARQGTAQGGDGTPRPAAETTTGGNK